MSAPQIREAAAGSLRCEPLAPFGLLVEAAEGASLWALESASLETWVARHGVVILRGFAPLNKFELPTWCRRLGEPQVWDFGTVNELRAKPAAVNQLFTPAAVPLHWDGALSQESPALLFFHCVEAPPPGSGGETSFVDTRQVLQSLSPAERERFSGIEITYSTRQGAAARQPLIAPHPRSGEAVLRYAEPIYEGNPVSLRFEGLDSLHQEALQDRLATLLHDPAVSLSHRWRAGDYLLADNQALLHGRRAYAAEAPRHLRRVNVLPRRPAGWPERLKARLRLRRPEYLVSILPVLLIPLLLMAASPLILTRPVVWAGLLGLYLLFNVGDLINCLVDRDLDAVYKPKLSRAVYLLGVSRLKAETALTALAGLGLCLYAAWSLGRMTLLPLWLFGLWLAGQYSLPPLRMKSGGLLQFLGWWGILYGGPMLFSALLAGPVPRPEVLVFTLSFGALQSAIMLVNSAEDYPEDLEMGMRTVIVATGPVRGMVAAAWLILLAGALHLALLLRLSAGAPMLLHGLTALGTGFWLWVCYELWLLKGQVQAAAAAAPDGHLVEAVMPPIRRSARRVPLYLAVIALGNLAWVLAWAWLQARG